MALSAIGAVLVIGVSVAVAWPSLTGDGEQPDVAGGPESGEEAPDDADPAEEPDEADPGEEPEDEEPEASEEGTDEEPPEPEVDLDLDEDGRPDRDVPAEEVLTPLEVDEVPDDQRAVAELLLDIDASERSMLGFQLEVEAAFADGQDPDDPDALDGRIRTAAAQALEELDVLRDRMQAAQDEPWAEDVRDAYVAHLDSWVRYLEAIFDEPQVLLEDTTRYSLDISVTGAEFSRAVHDDAADGFDDEVVRFAEDLVARGFPPPEDSQV